MGGEACSLLHFKGSDGEKMSARVLAGGIFARMEKTLKVRDEQRKEGYS